MAARTRKLSIDDRTKLRIQSTQLINALQGHVLDGKELKDTQVRSALGLLKKTVPDLAVHQHAGPDGGPVQITVQRFTDEAQKP